MCTNVEEKIRQVLPIEEKIYLLTEFGRCYFADCSYFSMKFVLYEPTKNYFFKKIFSTK